MNNISQYLGELMIRLLDTESFLRSIALEEMDKEDIQEQKELLGWCSEYQKTIAFITQLIRTRGLNSYFNEKEGTLALLNIEKFLNDLEKMFPEILSQNGMENIIKD